MQSFRNPGAKFLSDAIISHTPYATRTLPVTLVHNSRTAQKYTFPHSSSLTVCKPFTHPMSQCNKWNKCNTNTNIYKQNVNNDNTFMHRV